MKGHGAQWIEQSSSLGLGKRSISTLPLLSTVLSILSPHLLLVDPDWSGAGVRGEWHPAVIGGEELWCVRAGTGREGFL